MGSTSRQAVVMVKYIYLDATVPPPSGTARWEVMFGAWRSRIMGNTSRQAELVVWCIYLDATVPPRSGIVGLTMMLKAWRSPAMGPISRRALVVRFGMITCFCSKEPILPRSGPTPAIRYGD